MTKLKIIPITDFLRAMHRLEDRTNQCIAVNGDYFEQKNLFRIFWNFFCGFRSTVSKTYGTHCVYVRMCVCMYAYGVLRERYAKQYQQIVLEKIRKTLRQVLCHS